MELGMGEDAKPLLQAAFELAGASPRKEALKNLMRELDGK
jgi:hypothetical protein